MFVFTSNNRSFKPMSAPPSVHVITQAQNETDLFRTLMELYFYCNSKTMLTQLRAKPLLNAVYELARRVTSQELEMCSSFEREHNLNMYLIWDGVDENQLSWYTIKRAMFSKFVVQFTDEEQFYRWNIFQTEHPMEYK